MASSIISPYHYSIIAAILDISSGKEALWHDCLMEFLLI